MAQSPYQYEGRELNCELLFVSLVLTFSGQHTVPRDRLRIDRPGLRLPAPFSTPMVLTSKKGEGAGRGVNSARARDRNREVLRRGSHEGMYRLEEVTRSGGTKDQTSQDTPQRRRL